MGLRRTILRGATVAGALSVATFTPARGATAGPTKGIEPPGATPGTMAAQRYAEIVHAVEARFDLWPGLGMRTRYSPQFATALAEDDAARRAFDVSWSQFAADASGGTGTYAPAIEAHRALVLDVQRTALADAKDAISSSAGKAWVAAHEEAMLTAYLRAWAGRAALPARLAALTRGRLSHWEEELGVERIFAVAATSGVAPPKKGFSLGAAPSNALGSIQADMVVRAFEAMALGDGVVPTRDDSKACGSLDPRVVLGLAALSRDGKWSPSTKPIQPATLANLPTIETKALAILTADAPSMESRLEALGLLDKAAHVQSLAQGAVSTSVSVVVAGYVVVFGARKSLSPSQATLAEYARVRLAVLDNALGASRMAAISTAAKLPYAPGMWALPGTLP